MLPTGRLIAEVLDMRCALGRSGVRKDKREGDGATPAGRFALRRVLYRADRGQAPPTHLPIVPLAEDDGWCDAANDPAYNRPVRLPYSASAEALWRCDGLYDIVVVLGHNDQPVIPGRGSAIFLHLARNDYAPTEGCMALAEADLRALLTRCDPYTDLIVLEDQRGPKIAEPIRT